MTSSNPKLKRPLSPHLQIYKPQITSVLSILHRITGAFLSAGALVMAYWLYAAAYDMASYECVYRCFSSIIGRIALIAWTGAFYYHLCNGIRHLFWDAGMGFEIDAVQRTGMLVLLVSVSMTVATWVFILLG
jgi:succinate dehydrogenase / fumarate reductase cytochrome b subunit